MGHFLFFKCTVLYWANGKYIRVWLYLWLVLLMLNVTETWNQALSLLSSVLRHCHSLLSLRQHFSEDNSTETYLQIRHLSLLPCFQLCFKHPSIANFFCKRNISKMDLIISDFFVLLTFHVYIVTMPPHFLPHSFYPFLFRMIATSLFSFL